jgi:hypothetical protein
VRILAAICPGLVALGAPMHQPAAPTVLRCLVAPVPHFCLHIDAGVSAAARRGAPLPPPAGLPPPPFGPPDLLLRSAGMQHVWMHRPKCHTHPTSAVEAVPLSEPGSQGVGPPEGLIH